jgi:magnesium transporter
MTVIAAYHYNQGTRVREIALDEKLPLDGGRSDFSWISLSDPSEAEIDAVRQAYRLHPLAVEIALDPSRAPTLHVYNHELFVVARTAELEGDNLRYGMTALFVGANHLISVRHGNVGAHEDLREQLEAAPSLLDRGVDYVLHAILLQIVDKYLPIFEAVEDRVLEMERRSLDSFLGRDEVTCIFLMRCQLTRFQRTLGAMAELVLKLVRGHFPCVSREAQPFFNDVLDHVKRVQTMVDGLLTVLSSVFECSSLLEQQRTGEITRRLAAWAGILAAPTALANIFGMNFTRMPGLDSRFGYLIVLGGMAIVCLILFARFKRLKWI